MVKFLLHSYLLMLMMLKNTEVYLRFLSRAKKVKYM
nr:MAG TPA_asm: hypothetical protein [Caudoviricetes sp.]